MPLSEHADADDFGGFFMGEERQKTIDDKNGICNRCRQ